MKSVRRKPVNLELPKNLCRYDPSTDTVRDMRTGVELGRFPTLPRSDYQFFSTWFEDKVAELRSRMDDVDAGPAAAIVADVLVSSLMKERVLAS